MSHEVLAYFLTYTTAGSWLHGDERGSYDQYGQFVTPNKKWLQYETVNQKLPPVLLTSKQRQIVRDAIQNVCRHRGWTLHALNVRTNHVHVIVTADSVTSDKVLVDFKAWSTRALRESKEFSADRTIWTRKCGNVNISTMIQLNKFIKYVLEEQDKSKVDDSRKPEA